MTTSGWMALMAVAFLVAGMRAFYVNAVTAGFRYLALAGIAGILGLVFL